MPMLAPPSTASFAPRRFADQQRPPTPQGDGSEAANGFPPQQSASAAHSWQTATPPPPQTGATGGQQQTFAQMQAQGMARPNPLGGGAARISIGSIGTLTPSTWRPPPQLASLPPATVTGGTTGGTGTPPPPPPPASYSGPLDDELLAAIRQAIEQPSRYDMEQVQQVRDAFTGKLQQQFGSEQQSLDEEMARRGLSASTIGSQYQTDMKGRHGDALASLDASLIQDAAGTWANDRSSALSAGQNFANMGLQNSQFRDSLAQALGIAQMSDKTANRSVDAQAALAQNDLMLRVMALLQGMGGAGAGGSSGLSQTTTSTGTGSTEGGTTRRGTEGAGTTTTGGTGNTEGGTAVYSRALGAGSAQSFDDLLRSVLFGQGLN